MTDLLQTPLHAWHAARPGRLVDFAGWSMPVQYDTIVAEHLATRSAAGLFDISHMGRLMFQGAGAGDFLEGMVTRSVAKMKPGGVRYSLLTDDQGGILDDILVYRLPEGPSPWMMVVNAGNREKIVRWLAAHGADSDSVGMRDETLETAMIAVQGPLALEICRGLMTSDPGELKYYTGGFAAIAGVDGFVSRTGYTGEDGCEWIVPAAKAEGVWQALVDAGGPRGLAPAGLGARDTLRLEAGMPLYGHELSEDVHPLQAGLAFAVSLEGRDFPGADALRRAQAEGGFPRLIGLHGEGRRVPRENYPVCCDGRPVGRVTSGTFSPTLQRPIAMAYVEPGAEGAWSIDVRGKFEPAQRVDLPFYRRPQR